MRLSRPNSSIQALQNNRRKLLGNLLRPGTLLIGTAYDVLRRCGNPSCHCAKKPTHKQTLFFCMEKGKRRCRFVRQGDVARVREACGRYREFRSALKQIRAINKRESQLLLAQMKARGVAYKKLI